MRFLQKLDLETDSSKPYYRISDSWDTCEAMTIALAQTGLEYHPLALNSEVLVESMETAQDWLELYSDLEEMLVQHQSEQLFVIPCQHSQQRITALEEQLYPCKMLNAVLAGELLFAFRTQTAIYECLCQAGDLIVLPENQPFWMDLGENPNAVLLRALPGEVAAKGKRTGTGFPGKCSRLSAS